MTGDRTTLISPSADAEAVQFILVSPDERERHAVAGMASGMGFAPAQFTDTQAALDVCRPSSAAIVLADMAVASNLPDLVALWQDRLGPHQCLVMALLDREDDPLPDIAGDYLVRPLRPAVFQARMNVALRRIKARAAVDQRIHASEERLRLATETTGIGIWDIDPLTQKRTWSQSMRTILGLPADAPADRDRYMSLIHPDDRALLNRCEVHAALPGGSGAFRAEYRIRRADNNEERWIIDRGRVFFDDTGQPVRFLGALLDITERKRAADDLRISEERLRLAQAAARIGVWELHFSDSSADYLSPEARALCGCPPDWAYTYAAWLELVHPADRNRVDDKLQQILKSGQTDLVVDYRLTGPDGATRWHQMRGRIERDEAGVPRMAHGIIIDETPQKENEARLKIQEGRLGAVFQSRITGLTIFDVNTLETLAINDRMLELTGHTREEFESDVWDWVTFTPPECMPLDDNAIRQAREKGAWEPYEKEYVRKDGTRVPVRLTCAPLPGEPGRVIVSVEDMTLQRQAMQTVREREEQLQARNARLDLALQSAGLGIFEWNMSDNCAVWENARMFDIFARPMERGAIACNDFLERVLHPDDRPLFEAQIAAAALGKPFHFVGRIYRDDGAMRWIEANGLFEKTIKNGLRLIGIVSELGRDPDQGRLQRMG